jgi:molybdate transport system substrate-binding protein
MRRMFIIALVGCSLPLATAAAQSVTVSAAVSLKESLTEVAQRWKADGGADVKLNFGATGQLLAQIREGAPVDVFIAAADEQMDQAITMKLVDAGTRTTIAGNALVLIVPADSSLALKSFADLRDPAIKRLAIGQPKTVPAGMYAMQVLERLSLAESLKDRLVLGGSVRQVLDYVERGEVDAGIVYATDARQARETVRVIATADPAAHAPIRYSAAIVSRSENREAAKRLLDYLPSPAAQASLADHGFQPATTQPAHRD